MNTLEGIDARGYLANWLGALNNMYSADVNAIPEDKWKGNFGGCTRTAGDLTADAISLLEWTTMALQGDPPAGDGYEGYMSGLKNECSTRSGAIGKLQSASDAFNAALKNASDETLNKVVTTPFGMQMPLYMVAQIAVSHVWYHDGQLNYIHCLMGDDKVHWTAG